MSYIFSENSMTGVEYSSSKKNLSIPHPPYFDIILHHIYRFREKKIECFMSYWHLPQSYVFIRIPIYIQKCSFFNLNSRKKNFLCGNEWLLFASFSSSIDEINIGFCMAWHKRENFDWNIGTVKFILIFFRVIDLWCSTIGKDCSCCRRERWKSKFIMDVISERSLLNHRKLLSLRFFSSSLKKLKHNAKKKIKNSEFVDFQQERNLLVDD